MKVIAVLILLVLVVPMGLPRTHAQGVCDDFMQDFIEIINEVGQAKGVEEYTSENLRRAAWDIEDLAVEMAELDAGDCQDIQLAAVRYIYDQARALAAFAFFAGGHINEEIMSGRADDIDIDASEQAMFDAAEARDYEFTTSPVE